MTLFPLSGLLILLMEVPAALIVFFKQPSRALNRSYALFCLAVSLWGLGCLLIGLGIERELSVLVWKLAMAGVSLIPGTLYRFTYHFCKVNKPHVLRAADIFGVCFVVVSFTTDLLVKDVRFVFDNFYYAVAGPLCTPFLAGWVTIVSLAHRELLKRYRAATATDRKRTRLLSLSFLIGFLGGTPNFLPFYGIDVYPLGNFLISVAGLLGAYAIFVYRLLDVELVVTRASVLLVTYLAVLGIPFVVGWHGQEFLRSVLGETYWWTVPVGLCTALAAIGPLASRYLGHQVERRLLSEQHRYQRTLQHAARGMTQVRNVGKLAKLIVRVVSRAVHVTHASLLLWDKKNQRYVLYASHGPRRLSTQSRYGLEASHPFIAWLRKHRRILTRDELSKEVNSDVWQELANLGAVLAIPGLIEDQLIGFLALGEKLSRADYSNQDLHAFSTLAHEGAIAIENADSYDELNRVNKQLKVASDRLLVQERLAAAGQLAAGMAHEIRNPLSSIKTFAEYLPEKYGDPEFRRRFFQLVQGEIERIDDIVQQLLEFAKPAPLQLRPVCVSKLTQEALALLSDRCLKQSVRVETSFFDDGLAIQADPQQLKQVVLNLLLNSLDAMPTGGELNVSTSADERESVLRIADAGEGVPLHRLHHVWDPFFTTKERGMGLGLAIVKGIVERHGGRISLSSEPGKGTVVEVRLPTAPRPDKVSPEVSPSTKQAS